MSSEQVSMGGMWRVDGSAGVWLVHGDGHAAARTLRGEVLAREAAAARVDTWFPDGWGPEGARSAGEICQALGVFVPGEAAAESGWLKRALQRALRDGRVTAIRVGLGAPVRGAEDEEPVTAPRARRDKTWIEVVLQDEGGRPVAFAKYRIELPGGGLREGTLDSEGRARLDGIDPGTCYVTFPTVTAHPAPR